MVSPFNSIAGDSPLLSVLNVCPATVTRALCTGLPFKSVTVTRRYVLLRVAAFVATLASVSMSAATTIANTVNAIATLLNVAFIR